MPYAPGAAGTLWRDHRRVFDKEMTREAVCKFWPTEVSAVDEMLRRLLATPAEYAEHARHMAGQTIMSIAYGMDVRPHDDPYIAIGETANDVVAQATVPGSYLVDTLPFRACEQHAVQSVVLTAR
jgi:cytochrome P450